MTSHPFFSIIVPLYNKEDYIQNTLNSILKQTFKDFEIIIINDGSTDKSFEKAKETLKNFKNHIIINQSNKGLSATRNNGISLARGKLVALIDADDQWQNTFLEIIHGLYLKFPDAGFFGTDYLEKYSNNNILETRKNIDSKLKNESFIVEDFFHANMFQSIICQSCIAFKKEIARDSLFDVTINYAEDVDFYLKFFTKHQLAYHYSPLAIISYNIPNQITEIGIKNKKLPDLDFYQNSNPNKFSLLKYIDFKRYMYAIAYKLDGDKNNFDRLTATLNYNNLSFKQRLLLNCPLIMLKALKFVKKVFLKYNIRLTSFKG